MTQLWPNIDMALGGIADAFKNTAGTIGEGTERAVSPLLNLILKWGVLLVIGLTAIKVLA